jgi:hypothetical protein
MIRGQCESTQREEMQHAMCRRDKPKHIDVALVASMIVVSRP